jgi:hypothetical protein
MDRRQLAPSNGPALNRLFAIDKDGKCCGVL